MADHSRRALVVTVASLALWVSLAGVAAAHDCSSPRDCEQTAGYNAVIALTGGIVAVGAGLIGVYVGTSAGTMPTIPPAGAPVVTSAPATTPTAAAAAAAAGMPPGYIHHEKWGWIPADEVPLRDAEAAADQREIDSFRDQNRTRGQDPGLKAITDRIRQAEDELKRLQAEGTEREKQYWTDYRDTNAAQAQRYIAQSQKLDRYSKVASAIQTGADVGVSVLSRVPGGKVVSSAYTFTKTAAGKLAEGESMGAAVKAGATETVLDLTAGAIQDKVGLGFKTPNLPNVPVGDLVKSATSSGAKSVVVAGAKELVNVGVGEGIKYPLGKGAEFLGVKKP